MGRRLIAVLAPERQSALRFAAGSAVVPREAHARVPFVRRGRRCIGETASHAAVTCETVDGSAPDQQHRAHANDRR